MILEGDKKEQDLIHSIIQGMEDKKALDIVLIDMKKLNSSICDYFVVCHGTSNTQVGAIADEVIRRVHENTSEKPFSKEGYNTAEWILLDYSNVLVHIFQHEKREFYNIEGLWADAKIIFLEEQTQS